MNYYFADREFDDEGHRNDLSDNGKFRDYNINNYIEFGLTDKITLINSLYYKKIEKEDDVRETKRTGSAISISASNINSRKVHGGYSPPRLW